ncbi:MAG: TPM domain-containing protein [Aphanocapsa sp. GSE-SYN-MK-11-07L]|nr:TPM domain-containing protein [Aphanocapsa sp. GSE-SYN-MK-11-07L]
MAIAAILWLATIGVQPAFATGVYDIPPLDPNQPTWVLDQADVISPLNQGKLDKTLSNLAQQTGNQVRIVTVRRLDYGETPDSFTSDLFTQWFPSSVEQANQVLIVLDTVTNGTAIRTGEKAQTQLPPDVATSVAQETMRVPLREGNYNQSLVDAANRLSAVLSGEADPGPPEIKVAVAESTFKSAEETDDRSATIIVIGLLIAATVIPMVTYFMYQSGS